MFDQAFCYQLIDKIDNASSFTNRSLSDLIKKQHTQLSDVLNYVCDKWLRPQLQLDKTILSKSKHEDDNDNDNDNDNVVIVKCIEMINNVLLQMSKDDDYTFPKFWTNQSSHRKVTFNDFQIVKRMLRSYYYNGSKELDDRNKWFMGTARQYMCGIVVSEILNKTLFLSQNAFDLGAPDDYKIHPIMCILLNPTAGLIGKGNKTSILEKLTIVTRWIQSDAAFYMHAICHDAFGFVEEAFHVGPGYNYIVDRLNQKMRLPWCWVTFNNKQKISSPSTNLLRGYIYWQKLIKSKSKNLWYIN